MSKAKKCDRCGKLFDPNDGNYCNYVIVDVLDRDGDFIREYVLCIDCSFDVRACLARGKKDE